MKAKTIIKKLHEMTAEELSESLAAYFKDDNLSTEERDIRSLTQSAQALAARYTKLKE